MQAFLVTCQWMCRLVLGLLVMSAGGCLALMARGAVSPPIVVRGPCGCGWSQPVPVVGPVAPSVQVETGPR